MSSMRALILLISTVGAVLPAHAYQSFDSESSKLAAAIKCPRPKISAAMDGVGRLWGCISGDAETVKVFINETAPGGSNKVRNMKFMWNDYTADVGNGVHTDQRLARSWLSVVLRLYMPNVAAKAEAHFIGSKKSIVFKEGGFTAKYTYDQGPAIGERLLVVTKD